MSGSLNTVTAEPSAKKVNPESAPLSARSRFHTRQPHPRETPPGLQPTRAIADVEVCNHSNSSQLGGDHILDWFCFLQRHTGHL